MGKFIDIILVSQSGFVHEIIGEVVRTVTSSKYSHAAVRVFDDEPFIIEATGDGIGKVSADYYDNEGILKIVRIPVEEDNYQCIIDTANKLVGGKYGLDDCIIGGATDLFGDDVGEQLAATIDVPGTLDCSALATVMIRCEYPFYASARKPSEVTPEFTNKEICDIPGAQIIIDRG